MIYTLKNDILNVKIASLGAELISVKKGGCEYMWQKNAEYWNGCAPVLFPICGRFYQTKYTLDGKEYTMGTHGFARLSEFEAVSVSDAELVLRLTENKATLEQYPFEFSLTLTYALDGNRLSCRADILNTGDRTLPAAYGAHPGFNVPLDGGGFEDYFLEFGDFCSPDELVFSATCFNTGKKKAWQLEDGKRLPLRHSLFDVDGVFFSGTSNRVTLKSELSERFVTLCFDGFPYLGIWHAPRTDAPYLCIEPWCGLPSFDGEIDDLATKNDMFRIPRGEKKSISYSVIFG